MTRFLEMTSGYFNKNDVPGNLIPVLERFPMHRRLEGKVVIATHNAGKLREMRELLAPYGVACVSASELGLGEPEETGATFKSNALIKARAAAAAAQLPAFADDSGLCVDALGGAPGVHSARFAKDFPSYAAAIAGLDAQLRARGAVEPSTRRAHFVSALALAWPDGHVETFEDRVDGFLAASPRGELGFGFDPAFQPDGHARTFGEMSAHEKHGLPADGSRALSHRARAFQALAQSCLAQ